MFTYPYVSPSIFPLNTFLIPSINVFAYNYSLSITMYMYMYRKQWRQKLSNGRRSM